MAIGKVSLKGIFWEDSQLTVNLSGSPVVGTDEGKALTIDTGAANTFKLAGSGDRVFARLETIEARTIEGVTIGTASFEFCDTLPVDGAHTFAVGDTAIGGTTAGTVGVKGGGTTAPDYNQNVVVEVLTGFVVVMKR